jgi:hypothetical protein
MPEKVKTVKYDEGQWFAVPLKSGGYGIGIIVRGRYRTKGGLGYFFGPRYLNVPTCEDTYSKNKNNPILIGEFSDLGIIKGEWPLISNGKPFSRADWPVPLFHRIPSLPRGKAYIVEYDQDYNGVELSIHEHLEDISDEILKLPYDVLYGYKSLETTLTELIEKK